MKDLAKNLLCLIVLAASSCISFLEQSVKDMKILAAESYLEEKKDPAAYKLFEGRIKLNNLESLTELHTTNTYFPVKAFCDSVPLKPNTTRIMELQIPAHEGCESYIEFFDLNNNGEIDGNDFISYRTCRHSTITRLNGRIDSIRDIEEITLTGWSYDPGKFIWTENDPFDIFNIPLNIRKEVKEKKSSEYIYYNEKGEVLFLHYNGPNADMSISYNGKKYLLGDNINKQTRKTFEELKKQYEEDIFPEISMLIKELKEEYPY